MAIFLSNGVVVTLNSVDLSDHVTSATINRSFDELEVTAMGDTAHKFVKGLEASTITIHLSVYLFEAYGEPILSIFSLEYQDEACSCIWENS